MQPSGFQMLEDHPAVAVHDALGSAGSAGAEQHPERVIERHRGHDRYDGLLYQGAVVLAVEQDQVRAAE